VTKAQVTPKAQKVRPVKGFCQDIRYVVLTVYPEDLDIAQCDVVANGVELNSNVFHFRMKHLVFSQTGRGVVIAVNGSAAAAWERQAVKELSEEDTFVRGFMQCDVLSITG